MWESKRCAVESTGTLRLEPGYVNAGMPERVSMTVTGHQTRSVFDRYHILGSADLQDVARRLAGTIPGTIAPDGLTACLTPLM